MTSVESSRPRCLRSVEQAGDRLVGLAGEAARGCLSMFDVAVPAPLVLHAAGVDLHEPHAALDQPPGDQALLGEVAQRLGCRGRRASAIGSGSRVDVERLGGGHLHAVGQLEALDPRRQFRLRRRAARGAAG